MKEKLKTLFWGVAGSFSILCARRSFPIHDSSACNDTVLYGCIKKKRQYYKAISYSSCDNCTLYTCFKWSIVVRRNDSFFLLTSKIKILNFLQAILYVFASKMREKYYL